jgi:hypothetical protein
MYYPFLLYSRGLRLRPIFEGLKGDPFIADLSTESPFLMDADPRDQTRLQRLLEEHMTAADCSWGLSPYLERRETLLADCPQMVAENRFIHLGLDIIVPLGTPLQAPLAAVVAASGYESGEGNYGGYVLLEHAGPNFATFYSFYGHLSRDRLPPVGQAVSAGAPFAAIGDFHENGNWFHHTHLQIITRQGLEQGYLSRGYGCKADMVAMHDLCPSPVPLFCIDAQAA